MTERADTAEQEDKLLAISDKGETEDDDSSSNHSECDESEVTDCEEMLDNEKSKALETDHTANRLDEIERKIEEIDARLKENDKKQDGERREVDRMKMTDE